MRYTTVVFDLDGTLTDTLDDLRDSVNYSLRAFGYHERTREEISAALGNGARWLIEQSIPGGAEDPRFEEVMRLHREYYPMHSMEKTKPYEGIPQLLKYLVDNDYKIAVVSNKPDGAAKDIVEHFFGGYISVVIGEKPGVNRKPAPDTVKKALDELFSEPEESIYVGDTEVDIATAKNTGMDCISVTWGFRTKDQLIKSGGTNFADKPEDIIKFI